MFMQVFLLTLPEIFFRIFFIFMDIKNITILDKEFTLYLSQQQIEDKISKIAKELTTRLADKNPLFLCILNGSFMFASDIMKNVNIPAEISFIKLASYEGTSSTGKISELIGLNKDIKGRTVVIIEDIIDSGLTMQHLLETLKEKDPENIIVTSLLVKPDNLRVDLDIDYCAFSIPDKFIIGYGLDYNGYGRNYPNIYVIKE